jgi:hypothetical protein
MSEVREGFAIVEISTVETRDTSRATSTGVEPTRTILWTGKRELSIKTEGGLIGCGEPSCRITIKGC